MSSDLRTNARAATFSHSSTVYQERNSLQPSPRLEPKSPHSPLNPKITTPPSSQSPQLVASKRLNFQRCRQLNATMGHESSRPSSKNSRPMFSGSFDSSVKKRVNPLPARTDSTASDDAAQEMSGLGESFGLTASAGSIQNTANGANGKRLLSEKKTNGKPLRPTRKSQQMGISTSAQVIINFCVENAKGGIASRVVNRMASKRDDFNLFIAGLSGEQWAEFVNSLRNYFLSIVQHLHSLDKIRELSVQYGVEQVQRRVWGFKADYFSLMASSLTTECVFLDGAQHSTTETIEAWAELAEVMFSSIRRRLLPEDPPHAQIFQLLPLDVLPVLRNQQRGSGRCRRPTIVPELFDARITVIGCIRWDNKHFFSSSDESGDECAFGRDDRLSRYITMPRSRVSIRTTTPSNEPAEASSEPKGPRCVSSDECGLDARCDRSAGICRCRSGFRGEPKSAEGCIDVNECEQPGVCNPTSICINHIGGFSCQCPIGYRKMPDGSCTDIDECQERSGNGTLCDPNADCLNVEGSYSCSCRTNWTGDGYTPTARSSRVERPPTVFGCTYPLGSKAAMSRVNVSEPEPPEQTYQTDIQPRCEFGVTNLHNEGVNKAVVGQVLKLVLSVQPNRTYGVAPLNCFAMNVETKERHRLTDEFGCPADRDLFAGWQRVSASRLQATFRTFKWPECGKVRFECDCAPCVGACVDADCNEGHYRKRRMSARFRRQQMADEKAATVGERPAIAFSPVVDVREHSNSLEVERTIDSWNPFVNEVDSDEEQTAIETTDGFSCLDSGWLMAAVLAAFAVGFVVVWCELRRSRRSKKSAFVRDPSCRSTSSYIHFQ
ncbi:hypothetical protein M3Y99_00315800 [Aphelenchoides fujianensis]|nr:hypothetical protein M3Y99_00315800 [Aphelenchoides fujianensis]